MLLILSTLIITVELPVFREQFRVLEELAAVATVAAVLLPEVGEVGVKFLLGRGDRVVGGAVLAGGLELHTLQAFSNNLLKHILLL